MPVPARFSRLAWFIGSLVAFVALAGFPLFLCQGVYASDNVSLATAMEKYYKGDISGALKSIRAYLRGNPSDMEAKIWKGFIRLELARGLRKDDRERSEKIANSESYLVWCLWNNTEETNESRDEIESEGGIEGNGKGIAASGPGSGPLKSVSEASPAIQSLWYAAMGKAYWLGRRTPISTIQAYTHVNTALRMDRNNVEALQVRGEMALDGITDIPHFSSTVSQEEIDEYAQSTFEQELKVATKSHPEAKMRALYWMALAKCKSYPRLSPATLSKLLSPANSGSRDSAYVKSCLKIMDQGCPAE